MTTKHPPSFYLPIWEQAEAQEIGLRITVPNADQQRSLVGSLYECRKEFGGFEEFQIHQPHPVGTIFVVRATAELPE